jgi:hypothetical protein
VNRRSLPLFDKRGEPLDEGADRIHRTKIRDLHEAIKESIKRVNEQTATNPKVKYPEPPPYYALLSMDGDKVGELLNGKQDDAVSLALADFTGEVAALFGMRNGARAAANGVAIYAGGDDVLALTTVEDAIPAAMQLAEGYRRAFERRDVKTKAGETPDISAAIVFADHHEAFRDVTGEAHRLLERVAKEGNGRASLAIGVQKSSGQAAEWVGKWWLGKDIEPPKLLLKLAAGRGYSNRFPYNLRARYIAPAMGGFDKIGFSNADIQKIFGYELGKSRDQDGAPVDERDDMGAMAILSRPASLQPYSPEPGAHAAGLSESGLLVVRFLDQYGVWRS